MKAKALVVLLLATSAMAQDTSHLKQLYDQHRWPELRAAIKDGKAPALYTGAAAAAYNDRRTTEKYLKRAIRQAPKSEDAYDAHGILADVYTRLGRNRNVVLQLDAMLRIKPDQPDVKNALTIISSFGRHPDMSIGSRRQTTIHTRAAADGLVIPLTIGAKTVHWFLDTGCNLSVISESEARMLGLKIEGASAQFSDSNGGSAPMRTAVAAKVSIGDILLRNVPFLVVADSQPPMSLVPAGERGIIGLPVAVALHSIEWQSDGTMRIGAAPKAGGATAANLLFDGLTPVIRTQFDGKPLDFVFDTGNGAGSQLWSRFAQEFPDLLKEHGSKGVRKVTQVGGSKQREFIELPDFRLTVGGMETTLHPAQVFSKPVGDDTHHGLLGLDLMTQAHEVRIDFDSLTVELKP